MNYHMMINSLQYNNLPLKVKSTSNDMEYVAIDILTGNKSRLFPDKVYVSSYQVTVCAFIHYF